MLWNLFCWYAIGNSSINDQLLRMLWNELQVINRSSWPIAILSCRSKTAGNTIATDEFDTIQMSASDAASKVPEQLRLKPRSVTSVTFVTTRRGYLQFEPNIALVQRHPLPANRVMEVISNIPLHILQTNVFGQHANVQKHWITGKLWNNLTTHIDLTQLLPTSTEDLAFITVFNNVYSDDENTSSLKSTKIQQSDECRNSIAIPDDYTAYCKNFICMLAPFKSMWVGRLGHITTATHIRELSPLATRPLPFILYRAGPKTRYFERN